MDTKRYDILISGSDFDSSAIDKLEYDRREKRLVVYMSHGEELTYVLVPHAVWNAFKAAKSKGAFYNAKIKDRYSWEYTD